ncbi:MAG: hypothetical protein Q8S96_02235 [Hydrogenophaga sp.]|uniref:hypothetical protein n=1 Tax=Hydrogenophaga sp. TaxID=1904254 RepID=UPI002726F01B|nr:hypothetical protein [Hydrogenophaga sp.]MDO9480783.1 hypothetical protein [Hydrogenophaga sp.]MDP3343260.1 hypothetical protein [Hydrogenophaga sp.]MDP3808344.1 hypothetical protein [Hydrogenophaga sp.]
MSQSETFATAAHMHVLLRRKTGRVTDTEWMATNAVYATEIVRFAREKADSEGHTDLLPWADKLEAAIPEMGVPVRKPLLQKAQEALRAGQVPGGARPNSAPRAGGFADSVPASGFAESTLNNPGSKPTDGDESDTRYIGRLR